MRRKDSVAWECPWCQHRHLWKWPSGEADMACDEKPINMECDECDAIATTKLVKIGVDAYAAVYRW